MLFKNVLLKLKRITSTSESPFSQAIETISVTLGVLFTLNWGTVPDSYAALKHWWGEGL